MTRLILTAQVEDSARWEPAFRTHAELFRSQTVTSLHFGTTTDNEVAIYAEVDDVDKYFEILESQATADAMANDGVKRETVKTYILDQQLDL